MMYKTFDAWSAQGYRIHKGAKGRRTDKGTIVFSENQVWKPTDSYSAEEYDYDEDGFYGCSQWDLF